MVPSEADSSDALVKYNVCPSITAPAVPSIFSGVNGGMAIFSPPPYTVAYENMKYKYPEDQDPGYTPITDFQVSIVMLGDATMPAVTYSGKNVTLRGGTFIIHTLLHIHQEIPAQ